MEERELGRSGIRVTRIALGCGNFGGIGSAPEFFGQGETREQAFELMDAAWDAGIRLFDTAASYGGGRSERWIGDWMRARGRRPLVATKVFHSVTGDPHDRGLAPERIRRELRGSLERLEVERVDLYLIHEPDPTTPVRETLEALDALVRAGLVGAVGASNVDAAYLEHALSVSARHGLARFEWVQNSYYLLARAAAEDVLALCEREGLGFTPFGPLAGGWLAGRYRRGQPAPPGSRMTLRPEPYEHLRDDGVYDGLEALAAKAERRGTDLPAISLAWLLAEPRVTSVVVGPRRPEQLEPALRALELELSPAERDELAALFPF
jgi:aryl-alcohol dehydrogenase-like predicted oxidoreductase